MTNDERKGWTSASSAESDWLCDGRHLAQRDIPEPATSEDASRGQRIHAAMETFNPEALNADEGECWEQLQEMEAKAIAAWGSADEEYEVLREKRLWIEFAGIKHSGKADAVFLDAVEGRAIILDYKTGRGNVTESPRNLQLRDLAVLVARNHGMSEVTVAILQPFSKVVQTVYTAPELVQALEEMEDRVKRSNDSAARRTPGETQCKYCRAKATCPEFLAVAEAVATDGATPELMQNSIKSIASEKLGKFLSLVRLAEETATDEVRRRIEAGDAVAGWTLKPGRETEKITDATTVFNRALAAGVTQEAFVAQCITVGKTALKAALKTATGAKGKALDAGLDTLLAGATETKTSNTILTQI
jgi:RecB family exonuclease